MTLTLKVAHENYTEMNVVSNTIFKFSTAQSVESGYFTADYDPDIFNIQLQTPDTSQFRLLIVSWQNSGFDSNIIVYLHRQFYVCTF